MANAHPWLRFIVPFIRTPTNIVKFAAQRSPLAFGMESFQNAYNQGGAARDIRLPLGLCRAGPAVDAAGEHALQPRLGRGEAGEMGGGRLRQAGGAGGVAGRARRLAAGAAPFG
jgi:hypothetical protein